MPWSAIEALPETKLEQLFADDADRLGKLSLDVAGIHFDWSKTHLTSDAIAAFEALAKEMDLAGKREAMFGGAHVNVTEDRPVEHTAERGEGTAESVARAAEYHARMRVLVDAIGAEAFGPVRYVLQVGIGGSARWGRTCWSMRWGVATIGMRWRSSPMSTAWRWTMCLTPSIRRRHCCWSRQRPSPLPRR